MYKKLAEKHKKMFDTLVETAGVEITVREPIGRIEGTSARSKVLGTKAYEEDAAPTTTAVTVLWSNDYASLTDVDSRDVLDALGALALQNNKLDVVLRLKLEDVLDDPANKQGRTLFDRAKDVQYSGETFEITGTKRTGLNPIGPYILFVGLRRVGS
jgi:hypothetical protein